MKRIFAISLAIIMILALAACGGEENVDMTTTEPTTQPTTQPTTEPTTQPTTMANDKFDPEVCADLVGTWQYTLVLSGSMLHMSDLEDEWVIPLTFMFLDNGVYTVVANDLGQVLDDFEAAIENYMFENYHNQFVGDGKLNGLSDAKIEEQWQTQQETAREDAKNFVKNLSLYPRIAQLERDGDYYVEDGKVYLSVGDGYEVCSFQYSAEEDVLTLIDTDNLGIYRPLGISFPLILNRFSLIEPRV